MRALLLSVLLSAFGAGAASAASTASLQTVWARQGLVILDGRVWRCDGAVCAAAGRGRGQGLVRECTRVARKLGPLAAYARDGAALDHPGLERCNREARRR